MTVLIRRAKEERDARKAQPCRLLEEPPGNGLLVPELVDVSRRVHRARESVLFGTSKLLDVVLFGGNENYLNARYCFEVHIGSVGHEIRTCTGPNSGVRCATHVWRRGGVQDVIYFPSYFHLYDCVGKPRVGHDERYSVRRIPAIVELCVRKIMEKYSVRTCGYCPEVQLCVQAGAPIPDQYRSMMRVDVVPPYRDEVDLVA
ncbi:APO RNA-binding protein [Actinidia rufa]|uniref:APO RNA-binding protein n=1 Tax=Actinidia rufa TaxID=165716 RepID=A0A7J0GB43_9ERIC|nr:APO RNA-binding protein [Actinidia rufa]